jgi:hypothetical protein
MPTNTRVPSPSATVLVVQDDPRVAVHLARTLPVNVLGDAPASVSKFRSREGVALEEK